MLLYALGMRSGEQTTSARTVILLGKYSLFAYIAQIAILQVMRRMVSENLPAWAQGVTFLAATALTIAAVEVTNRLRKRSGFANRIYSAVFA
jgi:peptidoglycan/LPS O-acetylase OafA/YrhL